MPRAPFKLPFAAGDSGLQKGNLTHQQRLAIVRKKDEEPRWTQEDLARWAKKQFGLLRQPTQSTISNILKSRERLETMTTSLDAKSVRPVKHPELDAALLLWLRDRQCWLQTSSSGELVRDKARQLALAFAYQDEMTYSNGWMRSFLTRHGVEFRRNQVDPREAHDLDTLRAITAAYPKQDVFTFVSTNLWYRQEPKKDGVGRGSKQATPPPPASASASTMGEGDQVMEPPVGVPAPAAPPAPEPALVVGLGVNMDGSERWSPVFVSRAKQPPSFQQKSAFQWNFLDYYYNGRAQMTSSIFEVWLKRLNQRMALSHRRVLLVLDSAPSHIELKLSHVRVVVHAAAEAAAMRALSESIATAFKAQYRRRQLTSAVDRAEAGEPQRYAVSQLKAMRWIEQAWLEVPAELLAESWAAVGLTSSRVGQPATAARKKNELHQTLTSMLEQLDVPGRIKSQDVVTPRGEDDAPHYVYDDATIVPLVLGALQNASDGDETAYDIVDATEFELPADASGATSQLHRGLLSKLEQFRGVIQTIDEETPPSEEVAAVLAFLRRRQATLRSDLQRITRESGQMDARPMPTPASGEAASAGGSGSGVNDLLMV